MKAEKKKKLIDWLAYIRFCVVFLLLAIGLPYAVREGPIALLPLSICALGAFVVARLTIKRQRPENWRERVCGLVSDACYAYSAVVLPAVLMRGVIERSYETVLTRMVGSVCDILWVAVPVAMFISVRRFALRLPEKERGDEHRCTFAVLAYLVTLFAVNFAVAFIEAFADSSVWIARLGMLGAGSVLALSLLCFEEMVFATEIKLTSDADETETEAG